MCYRWGLNLHGDWKTCTHVMLPGHVSTRGPKASNPQIRTCLSTVQPIRIDQKLRLNHSFTKQGSFQIQSNMVYAQPTHASLEMFKFHIYTIWLFTYSDLKTIVGPKTAFGILGGLRAHVFGLPCQAPYLVIRRLPLVAFWAWINLLPFAIDNQRQAQAIREDQVNKPWRPLPSHRLNPRQATYLMLGLYPFSVISSTYLGGLRQCLLLIFLGIWYNDRAGADCHPLIRNFINASGFVAYTSGAMEVAYGAPISLALDSLLSRWLGVIGLVVVSTIHTQDMYDQAGDKMRGRWTVPLSIGDWPSRVTIAIMMAFWSLIVPFVWGLDAKGFLVPMGLGITVSMRTLTMRSVEDDKRTFLLWNLWIVTLYSLPFFATG